VQALELIPILESIQTEADVISALGNNIFGYPLNLQTVKFILAHLNFLIDEWRAGKTITDPYHTMGPDQINPNPDATYTKPILMLINQLDISGGDFVPAILQDNGRATLFGTRTSGAGGYVYSAPLSSRFGVASFSYTASIAERVNCEPIENLGVSPDIEYQLTEDDLRYGYEDYKEAINEAVLSLINHQKLPPKTHSVKREDPEPESGEEVVFITR
jgi:C-terminal processing protease CtpA/Prc